VVALPSLPGDAPYACEGDHHADEHGNVPAVLHGLEGSRREVVSDVAAHVEQATADDERGAGAAEPGQVVDVSSP
jgi:hypothetical protein